jgi:hypothetical protein
MEGRLGDWDPNKATSSKSKKNAQWSLANQWLKGS